MAFLQKIIRGIRHLPIRVKLYYGFIRIIFIRLIFCKAKTEKGQWLILERGYDAQDNAWHFFKYLVKEHPGLNVRFAIRNSSPDYENNLSEYKDRVLEYDSVAYYRFLFSSEVICSTHLNTYTPILDVTTLLQKSPLRYQGKTVFLQHGIIHQNIDGIKYPKQNPDLFISGARNEYKILCENYNYPNGRIVYTGLARYDNLIDFKSERQILIMPTWRMWYGNMNIEEFRNSEFCKAYRAILSNKKLLDELGNKGYRIVFYNHFEFQKFNEVFEDLVSPLVKVMKFGEKKVQDLLKESALLITDYSSIYYDFFYMRKPIIFYPFDKAEFDIRHYGKNYDDVTEFGEIESTAKDVSSKIIEYLAADCCISERHKKKADEVFHYHDAYNCQRIYEAVKNIL